MQWPPRVQEIVNELARRNIALVRGSDEDRRTLTGMFAEQCHFELGPNWGTKRADPGRPLSADVLCTAAPFVGWDTQIGGIDPIASDEEVLRSHIPQFPESIDLVGQVFISVQSRNHLGAGPADGGNGEPGQVPGKSDLAEFLGPLLEAGDRIVTALDGVRDALLANRDLGLELQRDGIRLRIR